VPDFTWEDALQAEGYPIVAGIDEAGRGPLAGPVVAAAVILPRPYAGPDLNDSKRFSEARREALFEDLTHHPYLCWAVAEASVEEIAEWNILGATHLAMRRAVSGLSTPAAGVLIDGHAPPDFPLPHRGVVRGDSLSHSIAAASIIAKVTRDRLMRDLAQHYPEYGFETHKGYGTPDHLSRLKQHGPCPIHRQAFRPVAELLGGASPSVRHGIRRQS